MASTSRLSNFKGAVEVKLVSEERDHTSRKDMLHEFQAFDTPAAAPPEFGIGTLENEVLRVQCKIWTTADFEPLRVLGTGAFGIVHLVRLRGSSNYFALKQVKKVAYRRKNHRDRAYAERHLLSEARNSWFVELFATFQDANNVYMVMEFLQGGDLLSYLERKTRLSPSETRFYMAQLLEAVDVVHKIGYVHRDIKPDNVVLNSQGHLKLLDFGLCRLDSMTTHELQAKGLEALSNSGRSRRARVKTSVVGTPQYMSPEAFRGECTAAGDVWSVGVLTFECLVGTLPFHAGNLEGSEAIKVIQDQVSHHEEVLPGRITKYRGRLLCDEGAVFVRHVLCDQSTRLTIEECRQEVFFAGLDFSSLATATPPFVPDIRGPADASLFEHSERHELPGTEGDPYWKDSDLEWVRYEYDVRANKARRPKIDGEYPSWVQNSTKVYV